MDLVDPLIFPSRHLQIARYFGLAGQVCHNNLPAGENLITYE
jgi:hypothetical protein